jgi:hypothetical protein
VSRWGSEAVGQWCSAVGGAHRFLLALRHHFVERRIGGFEFFFEFLFAQVISEHKLNEPRRGVALCVGDAAVQHPIDAIDLERARRQALAHHTCNTPRHATPRHAARQPDGAAEGQGRGGEGVAAAA